MKQQSVSATNKSYIPEGYTSLATYGVTHINFECRGFNHLLNYGTIVKGWRCYVVWFLNGS
jgi:hypothetical protein